MAEVTSAPFGITRGYTLLALPIKFLHNVRVHAHLPGGRLARAKTPEHAISILFAVILVQAREEEKSTRFSYRST